MERGMGTAPARHVAACAVNAAARSLRATEVVGDADRVRKLPDRRGHVMGSVDRVGAIREFAAAQADPCRPRATRAASTTRPVSANFRAFA